MTTATTATRPAKAAQVLIVDDDATVLGLLDEAFAPDEYDLVVASNGARGLELASTERPDVVLLDALMPGMDGFEVCQRLKANPATMDLPIIFMTACDEPAQRVRAFESGAVDYISKPFEMSELVARLRTHITIKRLMTALKQQNQQLAEEVLRRATAEETQAELTDSLRRTNARLEQELAQREMSEAARAALQQEIIAAQSERLLELSTPLIPINERIFAMPIVGTLDQERARRVMEASLQGVSARRAEFVILDITGVRHIDAVVADMLVRTSHGLQLLGACALVTGISPEVAKTLVTLGTPLGGVITKATLQDGIAYAMDTRGHRRGSPSSPSRSSGTTS
jgi:DNA-binding response OmpR family regulator/anti-anti-sigma regulatory factor